MRVTPLALALTAALTTSLLVGSAEAQDRWRTVQPGVRYLHRSTSEPKEIHALVVDLDRPEITLRATRSSEKGRTTTAFATAVGALAAVNGDFYAAGFDPIGLAIGEGQVWSDDASDHRFLACTAAKVCEIETARGVRRPEPGWRHAVGGNRLLVDAGRVVMTAADDQSCGSFCTTPHPRTAAGLSANGRTLILVVVEGRQGNLTGLSTSRLAALMLELGSHVALNLDGGGSSAMAIEGRRVSGRPSNEPAERPVANHLAILYDASAARAGRLVGFVREGDVFDASAGIGGATVRLSTGQDTRTRADGFYEFAEVTPGVVTVTAEAAGFRPVSEPKDVAVGVTNWKSLALARVTPDAGAPPVPDAGVVPPPDAGVAMDAGASIDSGATIDAGSSDPGPDAGGAAPDLGPGDPPDAAGPAPDAGAAPDDAGGAPPMDGEAPAGGCHGLPAPDDGLGLVLLAGVLLGRARRRRR